VRSEAIFVWVVCIGGGMVLSGALFALSFWLAFTGHEVGPVLIAAPWVLWLLAFIGNEQRHRLFRRDRK
jgi:hypothetical protein